MGRLCLDISSPMNNWGQSEMFAHTGWLTLWDRLLFDLKESLPVAQSAEFEKLALLQQSLAVLVWICHGSILLINMLWGKRWQVTLPHWAGLTCKHARFCHLTLFSAGHLQLFHWCHPCLILLRPFCLFLGFLDFLKFKQRNLCMVHLQIKDYYIWGVGYGLSLLRMFFSCDSSNFFFSNTYCKCLQRFLFCLSKYKSLIILNFLCLKLEPIFRKPLPLQY